MIKKLLKIGEIIAKKAEKASNEKLDAIIERLEKEEEKEKKEDINSILIKNGEISIFRKGKETITLRNEKTVAKICNYISEATK